jgi:peptidoglycan/xylan/chitin deacetylase (PgdA/CDA1 family)
MYHRIAQAGSMFGGLERDQFRQQMLWLKKHCQIISPEQYLETTKKPGSSRLPVLVTFDDGYRDYHDNAYPVLEELGIPSIVFLATSFIGTDRLIWTDAVSWAFLTTRRDEVTPPWVEHETWKLNDAQMRKQATVNAKSYLKDIPDSTRLSMLTTLYQLLDVNPDDGSAGRQMLTWDEVRKTTGYTIYGGHTHTHPILSQLSADAADEEIRLCRERILAETGQVPRYFAYPNGRAQDFTATTQESLKRHGFELGFSTIEGINNATTDRYAIFRQPTTARTLADFAWLVAGH